MPAPFEPAGRRVSSRLIGAGPNRGIRGECIAEPLCRANESRCAGRIAESIANLADEVGKVRFDNERVGPETRLQDGLREGLGTIRDERSQKLERFRRKVKFGAVLPELSGIEVEFERPELNSQNGSFRKPCGVPESPLRLPSGAVAILLGMKGTTRILMVVLTLAAAGCDRAVAFAPSAPSPVPQAAPPAPTPAVGVFPGFGLTGVSLSGVVYELTNAGRAPIAGALVYCEACGAGTHTWATADANGFYVFSGDLAAGGGVWLAPRTFTTLSVNANKDYQDPPGLPQIGGFLDRPFPLGPGWRAVLIDGNTTFDIELVRR